MEIQNYLNNYNIPVKKRTSERAELIKELYTLYLADKTNRRIANWKKYVAYCKTNKLPKGKESEAKFKKSKEYIKELSIKSFCYLLSHIKTPDLYYNLSVARDKRNRGENVGGWIVGSVIHR